VDNSNDLDSRTNRIISVNQRRSREWIASKREEQSGRLGGNYNGVSGATTRVSDYVRNVVPSAGVWLKLNTKYKGGEYEALCMDAMMVGSAAG